MIPSWPTRPARAWLLLALPSLVALVVLGNTPSGTRVAHALFDLAHVPVFGVMALILRRFALEGAATRRDALALGGVLAIGVLTEAVQAFQPERSASVADLLRDVAAGAAFLLLRRAHERGGNRLSAMRYRLSARKDPGGPAGPVASDERALAECRNVPVTSFREWRRAPLVIAGTLLLAACFAELGVVLAREVHRARAMPVLARFDGSWWERDIIDLRENTLTWPAMPAGPTSPAQPSALARLDLRPATYSGLAIVEPYADWRGYERLVMTVFSDLENPLPVSLRIHDGAHDNRYRDRYNTTLLIRRGENRLVIPLDEVRHSLDSREMDMGRIRGVMLFAHRLEHPTHMFLGEMRLE